MCYGRRMHITACQVHGQTSARKHMMPHHATHTHVPCASTCIRKPGAHCALCASGLQPALLLFTYICVLSCSEKSPAAPSTSLELHVTVAECWKHLTFHIIQHGFHAVRAVGVAGPAVQRDSVFSSKSGGSRSLLLSWCVVCCLSGCASV